MWTIILYILGIGILLYAFIFFYFIAASTPQFHGATAINKTLSDQYYFKKGAVTFSQGGNFFSLGDHPIKSADPQSFVVLGYQYAKDKKHVYFYDRVIDDADPQTFELLPSSELVDNKYKTTHYAKDKAHVFYANKVIPKAQPTSFTYLWGDYSRDAAAIYYQEEKLAESNSIPEKIVGDNNHAYLTVGNTVFFDGKPINSVDVDTFKVMGQGFAKDYRNVYLYEKALPGLNPTTFKQINDNYSRDDENVYYRYQDIFEALPNSDPSSFQVINHAFSKDKNQVYHYSSIVMNTNAKDFNLKQAESLDNDNSLFNVKYDNHHDMYIRRDKMEQLTDPYFIYENEVYINNMRIAGADISSFKVLKESDPYAKDSNNAYYFSHKIKGADLESFVAINSSFAKDKNHVYYMEKRLQGITPESFNYKDGMYGETIDDETAKLVVSEE